VRPVNAERAARAVKSGYSLRPPEPGDAEQIGYVHYTVWDQAYRGIISEAFLETLSVEGAVDFWREVLTQPDTRPAMRLVAIAPDETIAGMIAWGPSRDADAVLPDELYAIDVLRDHHGSGLADLMLLNSIGEESAQLVWVLTNNGRARSFYRRHGFVEQDQLRHEEALQADEMLMIRVP
jgi:ribosomal protein S18 acetylase RimI-like enzyme